MSGDFRVGDLVRITKRMKSGNPGWNDSIDKYIGQVATIKRVENHDCGKTQWYFMEEFGWTWTDDVFEHVMVIKTEKVMCGGKKCRKIVEFRGFPKLCDIGVVKPYMGIKDVGKCGRHIVDECGRPEWEGYSYQIGGPDELVGDFTDSQTAGVNIGSYRLNIRTNSVFLEDTFQAILKQIQERKNIYFENRTSMKAEVVDWSGIEEVVI